MKDYDAYLFDWDGTLARTAEIWVSELHKQALAYGLKVTRADTTRHFGDLGWALQFGLPEEKLDEYLQATLDAVHPQLPGAPLYDGAIEMLRTLKHRHKKLALVTTSLRKVVQTVMQDHSALHGMFDVIVTGEEVRKHKPDPEGINLILSRLNVPKHKALMLGDTGKDLAAASNAGIDSLLYYPETHRDIYEFAHLQSFNPTHTIHSWRAFTDALQ